MYELRYVGRSPFGCSVQLASRQTMITVTRDTPFRIDSTLTDRELRYYRSLVKCDIELVELKQPTKVVEEVIDEIIEEVPEEPEVTIEDIYEKFVSELSEDDVNNLCDQVGFSSRRRSKDKKFWDLLNSVHADEIINILLNE